ncbi:hypothetical protein PMAYCL1PPCAC_11945, partial [Pristionchus mayeri]
MAFEGRLPLLVLRVLGATRIPGEDDLREAAAIPFFEVVEVLRMEINVVLDHGISALVVVLSQRAQCVTDANNGRKCSQTGEEGEVVGLLVPSVRHVHSNETDSSHHRGYLKGIAPGEGVKDLSLPQTSPNVLLPSSDLRITHSGIISHYGYKQFDVLHMSHHFYQIITSF